MEAHGNLTGKGKYLYKSPLLIKELRQLGSTTLHQWAIQAEARVSEELKRQDPTVQSRKKKG